MDAYVIKINDRYDGTIKDPPKMIIVIGTVNNAIEIAKRLSDFYAGCDYIYYVEGFQ